ncbi:MAG: ATP-binding cassette domain-containing protein [Clostridia bacterium]|nr:ATP-binding cassette domain-containing protein [Clostridia bacterium]
MLSVNNLRIQFGKRVLFEDVNLSFTKGNCYGVIGANGAGKSTFLKVISGELEPQKGEVVLDKKLRMSILSQDQNKFDNETVLRTVLLGHKRLIEIMDEKEVYYSKPDFNDEDGLKLADLEDEFVQMDGWEAESNAQMLLNGIGVTSEYHEMVMRDIDPTQKVKVLLAQALFGNPDLLILDEPTNNLEINTVRWLEKFLLNFENTVIVVSHNRHFMNKVCTHICDIDYGKINIFLGNYDFWYETSQLLLKQSREVNKKSETRAAELKEFIARFSANASKSKQATARKKELEKLTLSDIKPSTRKYPFIDFKPDRMAGNDILIVENLTKEGFFEDVSFRVNKGDKIAFVAKNSLQTTMLFDILAGEVKADSGTITIGKTITKAYMPENNEKYFKGVELNLVDWLKQYSKDDYEQFIRGWLGRMLFSGDEALKKASIISGGEKVRCMLAKTMLTGANLIILDEPTNHLDLESISALNKGMISYSGNLLFASHDQEIVNSTANRIIEILDKGTIDKMMTYDEYLDFIENLKK